VDVRPSLRAAWRLAKGPSFARAGAARLDPQLPPRCQARDRATQLVTCWAEPRCALSGSCLAAIGGARPGMGIGMGVVLGLSDLWRAFGFPVLAVTSFTPATPLGLEQGVTLIPEGKPVERSGRKASGLQHHRVVPR
jgi:hypothetical protein